MHWQLSLDDSRAVRPFLLRRLLKGIYENGALNQGDVPRAMDEVFRKIIKRLAKLVDRNRIVSNGCRTVAGALVSFEVRRGCKLIEVEDGTVRARVIEGVRFKDDIGPLCECAELVALHTANGIPVRRFALSVDFFPDHDPEIHADKLVTCGRCLQGLANHRSLKLGSDTPTRRWGDIVVVHADRDGRYEVGAHSVLLPRPFMDVQPS